MPHAPLHRETTHPTARRRRLRPGVVRLAVVLAVGAVAAGGPTGVAGAVPAQWPGQTVSDTFTVSGVSGAPTRLRLVVKGKPKHASSKKVAAVTLWANTVCTDRGVKLDCAQLARPGAGRSVRALKRTARVTYVVPNTPGGTLSASRVDLL